MSQHCKSKLNNSISIKKYCSRDHSSDTRKNNVVFFDRWLTILFTILSHTWSLEWYSLVYFQTKKQFIHHWYEQKISGMLFPYLQYFFLKFQLLWLFSNLHTYLCTYLQLPRFFLSKLNYKHSLSIRSDDFCDQIWSVKFESSTLLHILIRKLMCTFPFSLLPYLNLRISVYVSPYDPHNQWGQCLFIACKLFVIPLQVVTCLHGTN